MHLISILNNNDKTAVCIGHSKSNLALNPGAEHAHMYFGFWITAAKFGYEGGRKDGGFKLFRRNH